jgi:TetR/AcrR family transcriptional regulator, transcriptional repressor of bet genes
MTPQVREQLAAPVAPQRKRLRHDERRRMIIDTTLLCLARDGTEGTSLRSVCRELGVAPSLVTHFFASWRDLLDATYRTLVGRLSEQLTQVVEADYPTARKRMDAVIAVYLSTDWAGENSIGASIAFWQLSRNLPELRTSFGGYLVERSRLLGRALTALVEEAGSSVDIDQLTEGLMLMLDGIWLEISLNPGSLDDARTQRLCWFWLDLALARA